MAWDGMEVCLGSKASNGTLLVSFTTTPRNVPCQQLKPLKSPRPCSHALHHAMLYQAADSNVPLGPCHARMHYIMPCFTRLLTAMSILALQARQSLALPSLKESGQPMKVSARARARASARVEG